MQKVYRLLRNNQQTGPYSLEEIVRIGLKSYDLIWVEGRSAGWSYPTEVDALKPYVPGFEPAKRTETTQPVQPAIQPVVNAPEKRVQPKKVFVSMPYKAAAAAPVTEVARPVAVEPVTTSIEQKAEELRQRAQAYMTEQRPVVESDPIKTNYARSLNDVEEEYTSWMYKTKTKKKTPAGKNLVTAGIIGCVLIGSGFAIKSLFFNSTDNLQQALTVKNTPALGESEDNTTTESGETNNINNEVAANPVQQTKEDKKSIKKTTPAESKTIKETESLPAVAVNDNNIKEETTDTKASEVIAEEKQPVTETAKQKKKGLKETITDLFKKKNKEEEPEQDRPVITTTTNGERNSKRRSEETTAPAPTPASAETVSITSEVEVKMNKPDNWMMGVQGLKVTLQNRSQLTLKTATVEILYYSEQNTLLEKKTIQFFNIAAGKSKTMAAPDHRLADHADYKIVSASGIENAYAKLR